MRALVTGAGGLLGGHLVRELLNDGHEVVALVRPTSNVRTLEGLSCERVFGDVRHAREVRAAVDGCEMVFHAAAVFAYTGYAKADMMTTAVGGTLNVLRAAQDARVRRLVLTSSTAVLGGNDIPAPLDEAAELSRSDVPDYFISKAQQEKAAIREAKNLKLELVVANPSALVGPYDFRPSASLAAITGYVKAPFKLTLPGGINLVHAADVARGHLLLAEHAPPYERHILSAENWRWETIHRTIAELLGLPPPRLIASKRATLAGAALVESGMRLLHREPPVTRSIARMAGLYFWYSHAKAARLGYSPRPTRTALVETLGWLCDSPHLSSRQKARLNPAHEVLDARDHLRAIARAVARSAE